MVRVLTVSVLGRQKTSERRSGGAPRGLLQVVAEGVVTAVTRDTALAGEAQERGTERRDARTRRVNAGQRRLHLDAAQPEPIPHNKTTTKLFYNYSKYNIWPMRYAAVGGALPRSRQ